jgi:GNAT superfamily N-acetyltransferase
VPVELDVAAPGVGEALVGLQRAAYAVEAGLIGHRGIPQLTETADRLRAAGLSWLGCLEDGDPVAALAWSSADGTVDVVRLVVRPDRFRRGLARALLAALPPAPVTVVATGRDNAPARALYASMGFEPEGDVEVAPGLWVTRLRRG